MISPRWWKLLRDIQLAKGRMAMMVLAIAVGIFGVGAILSAYTILTREISRNYLNTNPASALMELDKVSDSLVDAVRLRPEIADAEASSTIVARIEVKPNEWLPLLLFVVKDFNAMHMNTFRPESGAWPPPDGSILLEREALPLVHARVGESLRVQTPGGSNSAVTLSGLVHDPGLAPAGQEQTVYGYTTPSTLRMLGESDTLNILKIMVKDQPLNVASIEHTVSELSSWLKQQGHSVKEVRIPPPGKHPHQTQMNSILVMMFIFSLLTLLLSAILTATMIGGLLAQQVRQIGVMKAIGARSIQIAGLYLVLIVLVGIVAVVIGLPPSMTVGRYFARVVAELLNFTLYSEAIPAWVYIVQCFIGILVPLFVALIPIIKTTRITVREAIHDFGISKKNFGSRPLDAWLGKIQGLDRTLILALRNTFRRRGRLLLTLSLLAAAGGMFMTSLNVKAAWEQNLADAAADRHYDLEIRLNRLEAEDKVFSIIKSVPGVQKVETWNIVAAAANRSDHLELLKTYPDGGHGSFSIRSAPVDSKLIQLTQQSGRWLQTGDIDGVVLNHTAHALFPNINVGDPIDLTVNGGPVTLHVVGIAREIITPASAYVSPDTFAKIMGKSGQTNALRIVMNHHDANSISSITKDIEFALEKEHVSVKADISETRLDSALNGHVYILIFALIVMAVLMAFVGGLGLMSTMAINVVERTREFGIMRTIGGKSATVIRNVISEGLFIGLISWAISIVLSLPMSYFVGRLIGNLSFKLPLPLELSHVAAAIWLTIIVLGSIAASAYPAWQASRLTIRETLAHI
ncbi:ABC transporter permease [Paenibacillus hexagrammi]|uniref:ABC transporter permease n=1 Tax=Paenibacillus hexagrammi TaxID=2908839 RepID=A0ABY3SDF4_9BACL|nr:ABC transporter permease [Paenibacillus sp. YPD9-1]UJF31453.1 ABC transporter permease [Paenibacillus sp. YPD9-1]